MSIKHLREIPTGSTPAGAQRFSTINSIYLENDTKYRHSVAMKGE